MSEANKESAKKFLAALGAGDSTTLKTLVTDDVQVITPGNAKICGVRDYGVIMAIADAFPKITRAGLDFRILNLTAEENRVACEAEGYSVMANGKDYNNHYHFLMHFRDGKIFRIMEYLDTELADAVLGPYLSGAPA